MECDGVGMPDDDGKPAACEGATVAAMFFQGCDVKDIMSTRCEAKSI